VRLKGKTTADFNHGESQITEKKAVRAKGCDECPDNKCVRVTGIMTLRYQVTTHVTLPSVDDYPDLTPCQKKRVQDAIDNVLAPHEQQHVKAYETYNGTTEHNFDIKVCQGETSLEEQVNAHLQAIHDKENASREQAARDKSDALDPFFFDVDLDCEDESTSGELKTWP
jgi:hypothetical protein